MEEENSMGDMYSKIRHRNTKLRDKLKGEKCASDPVVYVN